MPDGKNNAKMTGDTHLPDVESELPLQEGTTGVGDEGTPSGRGRAGGNQRRPGRGVHKAGVVKDRDAPTSDSDGDKRESGEVPRPGKG